jgi:exocyst complex component 7
MDRIPIPPIKSRSFAAATTREDNLPRNLSLGPVVVQEEKPEEGLVVVVDNGAAERGSEPDLATLSAEIDAFLAPAPREADPPVVVSEVTLDRFASAVEQEVAESEGCDDKWAAAGGGEGPLLAAIRRTAALAAALTASQAQAAKYSIGVHRVTGALHRAMTFVEDEFHAALDGGDNAACVDPDGGEPEQPVPFSPETVARLRAMAEAMLAAGYEAECTQVFLVARRDAVAQALGYEKASIDDVVRMPWEALEAEVATWIKAFRHAVGAALPGERDLCARVLSDDGNRSIFAELARCALLQMLSFTEAVAMTKRAAEKLFKVLDMYEAVRDAAPAVDGWFREDEEGECGGDLVRSELASARARLGESAAAIFCDLESSIRADVAAKQPVPGGAVHPLTRYLMNYLKVACEYTATLEQVFREHRRPDDDRNPFAAELMELLHSNLEAKSRLYKDPALGSVFMMNNGRYMLQKIRGSPEINAVVGEAWSRKRSTDLRQYHKNYQRETWGRVLTLLRDDGVITVRGHHVLKPVLKERFKQFNAAMDEIQRTQGAWVVSDGQLQSELRVSIAAVIVPAYRSFLGRFSHHFTPGRQTDKYIKLTGEDLEAIIEELFDGNAGSMPRRRT